MSKRAEFPKVCKRHGITVTIFKQERDGYSKYRVVFYEARRRKELCRADYAAAMAEAELTLDRLANGSGGLLELKGTERLAWLRANELLKPCGLPIDLVAAEYATALKFLGNSGTLLETAKFYRDQKAKQVVSKEVDLAVTELLAQLNVVTSGWFDSLHPLHSDSSV